MNITNDLIWDEDKSFFEQEPEMQEWFAENVQSKMSFYVPRAVKTDTAARLKITEEIPADTDDGKVHPVKYDAFARPVKWEIAAGDHIFEIEYTYMAQNVNWNLNEVIVKVKENETV